MKYLLVLSMAFVFSCSNRNDVTTHLLNSKKAIEDSIKQATNLENFYSLRAKEEIHKGSDSLIWSSLADSSGYYFSKSHALKDELKSIEFSIDSISRMK